MKNCLPDCEPVQLFPARMRTVPWSILNTARGRGLTMPERSSLRPLLRLLGQSVRRRILFSLCSNPHTASEIASQADCTKAKARYHLRSLCDAGLIELVKDERPRQYQLTERVQIVRYRGKTVCSIDADHGEQLTFSLLDKN